MCVCDERGKRALLLNAVFFRLPFVEGLEAFDPQVGVFRHWSQMGKDLFWSVMSIIESVYRAVNRL